MDSKSINYTTYSMKSDIIFKEVFSKLGNEDVLKDFLESVLNITIYKLEILKDVALNLQIAENKYGILDLRATIDNNAYTIIEMKVKKHKYMPRRLTYYACNSFYSQLKPGEEYNKLKDVISICICDYSFLPNDKYVSSFKTIETINKNIILNNGQEYIFIELPKFRKQAKLGKVDLNDNLVKWLLFIDGKDKKGVEVAMSTNTYIKKADDTARFLTGKEAVRRIIELRKRSELDYISSKKEDMEREIKRSNKDSFKRGVKRGIEKGIEQGIEKGIEQGKNKKQLDIAKEMLKMDFEINTISKITKLPIDTIKGLK